MLSSDENRIGIWVSNHTLTLQKDFGYVGQIMQREYKNLDLIQPGQPIPEDIETMVILGGEKMTDFDIFQFDQFLMNGGKAFIALNGIKVIIQQRYGIFGIANENKLNNLLASYGIKVNTDLVGDNNSFRPLPQQREGYIEEFRYPVWPIIKQQNINKKNIAVENLKSINFYWPSSITVADSIRNQTIDLFTTTDGAWHQDKDYKLDVLAYERPIQRPEGKFTLGIAFEGMLTSYFQNKQIPHAPEGLPMFTGTKVDKGTTKLIVVSNEDFLRNDFINNFEFLFLLNSLDYLTKDGSLIEIRNKGMFSKPLSEAVNEDDLSRKKGVLIFLVFFLIPLLYIVIGVSMFFYRKNKNTGIQTEFAGLDTEIRKVEDEDK